jgi:hypothetical protein
MKTKARGIWAHFETVCHECGDPITISKAKPDPHECWTTTSNPTHPHH